MLHTRIVCAKFKNLRNLLENSLQKSEENLLAAWASYFYDLTVQDSVASHTEHCVNLILKPTSPRPYGVIGTEAHITNSTKLTSSMSMTKLKKKKPTKPYSTQLLAKL